MGAIPLKFCCTAVLTTDSMLHLLTLDKGNFILTINFLPSIAILLSFSVFG